MSERPRTAWVTGASSGIGRAVAIALSVAGYRVGLTARRADALELTRDACHDSKLHVLLPADLSNPAHQTSSAAQALEAFGHVDLFVHAAGLSQRGLAEQTLVEIDRRLMEVNFFAAAAIAKTLLPSMLARGSGHLVPISSVQGRVGLPGRTAYAASKHALHGFFDGLRAEVEGRGISVTLVCPGYVRTELSRHALAPDGAAYGAMDATTARGITPDACAQSILRSIARRDREVLVGGKERWVVWAKRLFPGLTATALSRRGRRMVGDSASS